MTNLRLLRSWILPAALATVVIPAVVCTADVGQTPLFGPQTYTRHTGPPQTITATFERCGTAPAQIVVVNGNADGTNRVSSASIALNGVQVVSPSDFNPHVERIVRPVQLADQNTLSIRLASAPGSFITVTIEYLASPAELVLRAPGVNTPDPASLAAAVTVANEGTAAAENVQLTSIQLTGGTLSSPALPFALGTIAAEGSAILNATFTGGPFLPGGQHTLSVAGTYVVNGLIYCFNLSIDLVIPPVAPGDAILGTALVDPLTVTGAPFPPRPPSFDEDESNPAGWTVPNGPFIPGGPPPGGTSVAQAPLKARLQGGPEIVFTGNHAVGVTDASTVSEPSGASGGGVVFMTANWLAAYSTNGGTTWTELDPTTIFPNDAVGFCCDQIVQYVPSIDRFVWFLQGNGYRLAVASPATIISSHGTAWTYWNLTPQVFGQPNGTGFDYPDMSLGNNSLYMSWDAGAGCPAGCTSGFQVVRTAFGGIAAGGTITVEFTNPANGTMCWGSHLMQDTGDEIFWAGHRSNSQMRIFSLAEGSNTYFWRDRNVSSWANNAPTSLTPDNQDWLAKNFNGPGGNSFPRNGVIGATRSFNNLWFGWTAGTNNSFQQAHVELVTFDRSNSFNKVQQLQIWNNSYAFAYPALTTNACTGEIGMSLEYGGNGNYENHVVGFWGDFVVYITSSSNVGTTRFGDYVTVRRQPPSQANPGNLFDAFGYGLRTSGGSTVADLRYVTFGRPASACNIIPAPGDPVSQPPAPVTAQSGIVTPAETGMNVLADATSNGLRIAFAQAAEGPVSLSVYDVRGSLVKRMDGTYPAGQNSILWDGSDHTGRPVATGIYLFRLTAGAATHSAKAVWTR